VIERSSSRCTQPLIAAALALALFTPAVQAQSSSDTPAPKADAKVKAQEEGDKVFKWIIINADRPKRAAPAVEPKPAAPAPRPVAKVREPKEKEAGIVEKVEPITRNASATPAKALATTAPAATTEQARAEPTKPAASSATAVAQNPAPAATTAAASAPADSLAMAAPQAKAPDVPPPAPADADDDEQLVLVKQVDPQFPRFLIERLEKGAVQVRFEVQPDGSVAGTQVVKSSHPRLNDAAMQAVAQWRFKPLHHAQSGVVELKFDLTQ
jgi:TonB family protein